jgi:hypothetical protein
MFDHHRPDCPNANARASASGDHFCDCHDCAEPRIGPDGREVAFPAGWTQAQAREWRRKNGLLPPSEPGSGP